MKFLILTIVLFAFFFQPSIQQATPCSEKLSYFSNCFYFFLISYFSIQIKVLALSSLGLAAEATEKAVAVCKNNSTGCAYYVSEIVQYLADTTSDVKFYNT